MGSVYYLTIRQLTGRWRLLIMVVLAALPILVTAAMLDDPNAPPVRVFEEVVLATILAGAVAPLVVLSIAGAAFANEIEDRTLANLTLSPLPRWQIVVAKLLAAVTIAAPLLVLSSAVTGYIAFLGEPRAVVATALSMLVAVALYASAFLWLGLVTSQAIGIGLLYIVLWEGFFAGFVAGVRALSIRHHSMGVMHGLDARRFAGGEHLELWAGALITVLAIAGFTLLGIRRLRRMDVP